MNDQERFLTAEEIFDTRQFTPMRKALRRAPNPWSRASWNITQQGLTYQADPDRADRLAREAGHRKAIGACAGDAL
jgi:hypothetical protein